MVNKLFHMFWASGSDSGDISLVSCHRRGDSLDVVLLSFPDEGYALNAGAWHSRFGQRYTFRSNGVESVT